MADPGSEAADRVCETRAMRFEVTVEVQLKEGVSDPQGATIERSLPTLGFAGVAGVRVGKCIRFELEAASEEAAQAEVADMCDRFLSNPVIEDSTVVLRAVTPA
jgi:phosphoribosylformylglycinamidine synthase subunit PurS